jgi:hypothetical protein
MGFPSLLEDAQTRLDDYLHMIAKDVDKLSFESSQPQNAVIENRLKVACSDIKREIDKLFPLATDPNIQQAELIISLKEDRRNLEHSLEIASHKIEQLRKELDFERNKFSTFQSDKEKEINRLHSERKAKIESSKSVPSSVDECSEIPELSSLTGKTIKPRKKRKTKVKEGVPSNQEHKSQHFPEVSEKMSFDEMSRDEMIQRKFD